MSKPMGKIAVIGAGASGIAAAHFLIKKGYEVEIIDRATGLGGRIGSERLEGRYVDFGGKNIGKKYALFRAFVADLGNFQYTDEGRNFSQVINGKLVTFDARSMFAAQMNLIRSFGIRDYLRLNYYISKVMRKPENRYLGGAFFNQVADKFDAQPISYHFGERFSRRFVRLFTMRSNGAEPEEYYLGNFGTNIGAMLDKYDVLSDGMFPVLQKFSETVSLRLGQRVTKVTRGNGGKVTVTVDQQGQLEYDGAIIATPAGATAEMIETDFPGASHELHQVRYFPIAVAIVKYKGNVLKLKTRTLLFDAGHALGVASAYSPQDLDLVRFTFSGKKSRQVLNRDTEAITAIELAENTLDPYFQVKDKVREAYIYRYFSQGACAYSPFHVRRIQKIRNELGPWRNVALCGDYFEGSSIEGCFRSAALAVKLF